MNPIDALLVKPLLNVLQLGWATLWDWAPGLGIFLLALAGIRHLKRK